MAQISSVGVFKRLRAAGPWFGWLARQMRGSAELPETITGRRLRAVDATSVHEPGSTGTDWKIHYAVNLADLECDFFQLTEIGQGGETFRRVPVVAGDIVMGDRVYASPPGVSHVVNTGGDVIVRFNRGALPLYKRNGTRIDLLPRLRKLKGKTPQEYTAWVKNTNGDSIAGRLIVLRQSVEATRWAHKRLQRRARLSQSTVTDQAREFAEYFMVWTTVAKTVTSSQILDLYRLRWQIELVFKRMKSILGLGHLPKTDALAHRLHSRKNICWATDRAHAPNHKTNFPLGLLLGSHAAVDGARLIPLPSSRSHPPAAPKPIHSFAQLERHRTNACRNTAKAASLLLLLG